MNEIYIFNTAKLAVKSMILVASAYPKPGLITPLDNSALDSTDYPCYVDGAMSLFQCLVNSASAGGDTEALSPEDAYTILKGSTKIGIDDALRATRGKLSFSGHVFCLGLLASAAGRLLAQERILTSKALALTASSFARGITERELWTLEDERGTRVFTPGERAYMSYGIEGCRGEAEHGFTETLKAVEMLRKLEATHGHLTLRERIIHTLINTMSSLQDSCLAVHGGIAEMIRVQEEAKRVIELGGMITSEGIESVFEMDKNLRSRGSSPRGSAVVAACAIFILELTNMKLTRSGYEE